MKSPLSHLHERERSKRWNQSPPIPKEIEEDRFSHNGTPQKRGGSGSFPESNRMDVPKKSLTSGKKTIISKEDRKPIPFREHRVGRKGTVIVLSARLDPILV
jgi:hypothetical protein